MERVITNEQIKYFYHTGDEIICLDTGLTYIVEAVDRKNKRVICEGGTMLELSSNIRPTLKTMKLAKYTDKRQVTVKSKQVLYFAKTKESAIIPSKLDENACYDLYSCFEENEMIIKPQQIKLIPTGIATAFDKKFKAIIYERGSTGTKGMAIRCGVIDSGYRNEWFIPINNTTDKTVIITKTPEMDYDGQGNSTVTIYPYTKAIGQFALEIVPQVDVEELTWEELKEMASIRGLGALGSSGK